MSGPVDVITPSLDRTSEKLQNAIYYAIDGDQPDILDMLIQRGDDTWLPWQVSGLFARGLRVIICISSED